MTQRFTAGLMLVIAALTACNVQSLATPTPARPTPIVRQQGSVTLEACLYKGYIAGWCGKLTVPENRAVPNGRKIDLQMVVLPATSAPVEPDPVFFLAGGPGDAATQKWIFSKVVFPALNEHRDFVLVDQRGTNDAHKIEYPPLPKLMTAQALREWMDNALTHIDADPRYYTTAIAMDDIDAARAALGYERINVYGNSYGATAAQVYLRRYENHVRAMVLDGGSLLDVQMLEAFAPNAQRALELVFARCERDPACRAAFPSVRQEFDAIIQQARQRPLNLPNPISSKSTSVTASMLQAQAQAALVNQEQTASLPKLTHQVYRLAQSQNEIPAASAPTESNSGAGLMMKWAILCSESWARRDLAETARLSQGTLFAEWALDGAREQTAICQVIPRGIVDTNDGARIKSAVPVLFLNGEADPQDPPANVANATRELSNSLVVIVPGAGHTVGHLGCLPDIVTEFIRRGTASGVQTDCVARYQPPPFELGD